MTQAEMNNDTNSVTADLEGLGDALGALSSVLLTSGFMQGDAHRKAWQRVVAEFQSLSSRTSAAHE